MPTWKRGERNWQGKLTMKRPNDKQTNPGCLLILILTDEQRKSRGQKSPETRIQISCPDLWKQSCKAPFVWKSNENEVESLGLSIVYFFGGKSGELKGWETDNEVSWSSKSNRSCKRWNCSNIFFFQRCFPLAWGELFSFHLNNSGVEQLCTCVPCPIKKKRSTDSVQEERF